MSQAPYKDIAFSSWRVRRKLRRSLGHLSDAGPLTSGLNPAFAFSRWAERHRARIGADYPSLWRTDALIERPARVAIVVHVSKSRHKEETLSALASVPVHIDLFLLDESRSERPSDLTMRAGQLNLAKNVSSMPMVNDYRLLEIPRGTPGVLSLIWLANSAALDPYRIILPIVRSSAHWHEDLALLQELADPNSVRTVLNAFATTPDLGMVSSIEPRGAFSPLVRRNAAEIARRIEAPPAAREVAPATLSGAWTRGFIIQGLRSLGITAADFKPYPFVTTMESALEVSLAGLVEEAGYKIEGLAQLPGASGSWRHFNMDSVEKPRARAIPFYLPQFHPIAENDSWWGKGFTEWTNVAAAKPLYQGHHQPKIPADLGFYDLRVDETRDAQAQLAKQHGLLGFMYYHYWFTGKPLLERPINSLKTGSLDFPYCIMWANENWTRTWSGGSDKVLAAQTYDNGAAGDFIDSVMPLLADPRYIRINGKALLAVYRAGQIPRVQDVLCEWRRKAKAAGISLHLLSVNVAVSFDGLAEEARTVGFDGTLDFPPHLTHRVRATPAKLDLRFMGRILSYRAVVDDAVKGWLLPLDEGDIPTVMVGFDNTARRQWNARAYYGSNPYVFRRWFAAAVAAVQQRDEDSRIVFINAWNEWAESAILEPSDRFGATYLLAVRDVLWGSRSV